MEKEKLEAMVNLEKVKAINIGLVHLDLKEYP